MIPRRYIEEWKSVAPWPNDAQVEQDLAIARALVEMFTDELLKKSLAFRGGTALHKLYLQPQARYSEDIDLVQINSEPINPILKQIRERLAFLGTKRTGIYWSRTSWWFRFLGVPFRKPLTINH